MKGKYHMISLYLESNEQNKVINEIETEAWTHGTDWQLLEGRGEDWMKEGGEISQRTYMHHPWTHTRMRR